ncbi:RloB family protein (plasmid) [Clostridium estertheticum]|uniref:RloB family protein n=1 Tax=Clostridium estertheticum TaxID=238834 RepID=UPI001C7DE4A2|nr:RloB family protein [Clostridium estertheticum]MBX4262538.1 RloB family protein [Clostridium estertheticum]WLC73356.1 RloB family protein [Clostridium estertheticum]
MTKLNRGGHKRSRKEAIKQVGPGNFLIVTEGTETEVNYFNNIKKIIESLFRNNIIVDKISLKVEGTARSTKVLVNEALKKRSLGTYSEVWVVFDKDDNDDFDEAIIIAKKEGLNVAWSNECFELWLLLHFQDLKSAINRTDYSSKLSSHFKNKNINKGTYDKNFPGIFDVTYPFVEIAIQRSSLLLLDYNNNNKFCPSKMNPCTTVQELVEILIKYTKPKS